MEVKATGHRALVCKNIQAVMIVLGMHAITTSGVLCSFITPISNTSKRPLYPYKHWSAVEKLYGTRYQSDSYSLINVGSGFHCLRNFSIFLFPLIYRHT